MLNEKLKGVILGVIIGGLLSSGIVLAKKGTELIEVSYNNIKVYKDNVLCELKDANGTVVEPFIYNGTTYMPVRGTANLADMEVTWEGSTQSVYLWDELVPSGTYLMEVCPPYEISKDYVKTFLQSKGKTFSMAGEKYSNGFTMKYDNKYALFNLDSKYSNIEFTIGHVDGNSTFSKEQSVSFFVDGKLVKEITIEKDSLPKTVSIPVSYGLQLKIITGEEYYSYIGFGNITIQ